MTYQPKVFVLTLEAKPGTWVHMPKGMRHSIQAKTPVVMLLVLMKCD